MNINFSKYGSGLPLVLFHGWGFNSQIWMPLAPILSQEYQLILVDLPGFGQSKMMNWLHFKTQLLNQLPKQFALVGWSMGGLYASRLAIESSERVTHLLNVASSPYFLAQDDWPGVAQEVFVQFYRNLSHDPLVTLNEFVMLHNRKGVHQIQSGQLPSAEGLAEGLSVLDTWDLRVDIKNLSIPVCYMFGRLDPIVPKRTLSIMQERYPQFHYVFFNRAAHMPFLSHQNFFVNALREFIT